MPFFFKKMGWQSLLHGKMNNSLWYFSQLTNSQDHFLQPSGSIWMVKDDLYGVWWTKNIETVRQGQGYERRVEVAARPQM